MSQSPGPLEYTPEPEQLAPSVAAMSPMTMAMTVPIWSAERGTNPNTNSEVRETGSRAWRRLTATTAHSGKRLSVLRKAGLCVRRTAPRRDSVSSETTTETSKRGLIGVKDQSDAANVARSKTELISPKRP